MTRELTLHYHGAPDVIEMARSAILHEVLSDSPRGVGACRGLEETEVDTPLTKEKTR